jgi:hypothetical protein
MAITWPEVNWAVSEGAGLVRLDYNGFANLTDPVVLVHYRYCYADPVRRRLGRSPSLLLVV